MKNGDSMKKKFYFVLFSALCISALLLGLSYSKESGTNKETFLNQSKTDNFKIVASSTVLNTFNESGTDISIVNKSNKESVVILNLELQKTDEEKEVKDVYYSINGSEIKKLTNNEITLGTLKNYGTNGDQATYNIKITSKSDEPIYYTYSIKKEEYSTLNETIRKSNNIYEDENHNLRYYGSNVNNYIKYENNKYRIVGIINNKVRLISSVLDESDYYTAKDSYMLLPLDDYLRSFTTSRIEESTAKTSSSWLREQQFWLNDVKENGAYVASAKLGLYADSYNKSHNNRYITEINSNIYVLKGDGTESNPYEVSYDS